MSPQSRWWLVGLALAACWGLVFTLQLGAGPAEPPLPATRAAPSQGLAENGEVDLASMSDDTSIREHAAVGELTGRAQAAAPAGPRASARLTLRVQFRGAPVADAKLWLTAGRLYDGVTDSRGEVVFDVPSGRARFGFESFSGALSDGQFSIDGGELDESHHVVVEDGVDLVLTLALGPAAGIRGVVLAADGTPAPDFGFCLIQAESDEWGKPWAIHTDTSGCFSIEGLSPGWKLLGADPRRVTALPFERFELARGEQREVTLRILPRRPVQLDVDLKGEVRGARWPLTVRMRLERAESLAALVPDPSPRPIVDRTPPFQWTVELSPGRHVVHAATSTWTVGTLCIAPEWERAVELDVAADAETLRVEVPVPDIGPLAQVQCTLTRALPRGNNSPWIVLAHWTARTGEQREHSLIFDTSLACELNVDLDEVPSRVLSLCIQAGGERRTLTTLALQPGRSSVSLTP